MKKIVRIFSVLALIKNSLYAQSHSTSIDSLISVYSKENNDLGKCRIAVRIAAKAVIEDSDLSNKYFQYAQKWVGNLNDNDSWYYYYMTLTTKAQLNQKTDSTIYYLAVQLNYLKKSEENAIRNIRIKKNLINTGIIYQSTGDNKKALGYLINANNIKLPGKKEEISTDYYLQNTLSEIYLELDNLPKSEEYALSALKIALQIDSFETAFAYMKVGKIFAYKEAYAASIHYMDTAAHFCKNTPTFYEPLFEINSMKAQDYYNLNNFDLGIRSAKNALPYARLVNSAGWISLTCGILSNCFAKKNNKDSVHYYTNLMLGYTKEITHPAELISIYEMASDNYEYLGDYNNALIYSKKTLQLKDSIKKIEEEQKLNELIALYDSEKKNNIILSQNSLLANKNFFLISIISIATILGITVVLLYIMFKNKKRQNAILFSKNNQIETLIRELHHRVKNNLQIISSLLSLQSSNSNDAGTKIILREGQNRVDAMSLIHQKLYLEDLVTEVKMKEYTETLVNQLVQSYKGSSNNIQLKMHVQEMMLHIDVALPMGLIINELVTNALKYGMTGPQPELKVSLLQNDERHITLRIKDNGCGCDYNTNPKESLGLKLIQSLTGQLNGKMQFDVQNGTEINIIVPYTTLK